MTIASTVGRFLEQTHTEYEVVRHARTETAAQSALAAHVPLNKVAKAILLRDQNGEYLMAVVPAHNKLRVRWLSDVMTRNLHLVREVELKDVFQDCELGAVPALGQAYGIELIWDEELLEAEDIYMESGDHEQLLHMSREQFTALMGRYKHDLISTRPEPGGRQADW
jgi:Ala-tRNA(Pro) deacylase